MVGNAAHGRLLVFRLSPIPGGERQIEFPGSRFGILFKHFIEISQAEKQEAVLVVLLNLEVLSFHWG